MDLGAVMDEVGDRLDNITGLRVHRYPPDDVSPPAAIVSYPETITYDETMRRGMDRYPDLSVAILLGKVSARATRDAISVYADGAGDRSIKAVLDGGDYESCDSVRVTGAEFDVVTIAAVDYLGVMFNLDIVGPGAPTEGA
jgi:hypothetical protein